MNLNTGHQRAPLFSGEFDDHLKTVVKRRGREVPKILGRFKPEARIDPRAEDHKAAAWESAEWKAEAALKMVTS